MSDPTAQNYLHAQALANTRHDLDLVHEAALTALIRGENQIVELETATVTINVEGLPTEWSINWEIKT